MVVVVEMIGKSENNSVKREKWQSLRKCIHLLLCPFIFIPFLPLFSLWVGGQGVNILFFIDFPLVLSWFLVSLMSISADAQKQQRLQLQQESGSGTVSSESRTATALTDQEQRNTLKFGFSSKGSGSKVCPAGV
ncbi:hypothetical protein V8G54_018680 [Vigna mungo]|uniref:Uncharacterized protein n=1 Tax=Vigna mungo TaxID=3915 RepID=A0AAQ3RRP6_VIGMU